MASKQNTTTTLENARKALAQIEQEAEGLVAARDKVLLDGGATSEAIEINKQIDATRRAVEAEQRRVHLLEQKLAEEEREAVARRHEEHVQEFESTLAEADRAGDDLEEAVARLEATFRKTILLRETAFSMWPHGRSSHGDAAARAPEGAALAGGAVSILLQHELHRVGTETALRGGERVKIPLPGGAPERLTPLVDRRTGQLVPLVPLAEKLRNASRFAVSTLRNDLFVPPVVPQPEPKGPRLVFDERVTAATVQQEAPVQQQVQPAAPAPAPVPQPAVAGDVDPLREYVPPAYRDKLAGLLMRQMQLAASGDDAAYERCLADLTTLQREIEAARNGEAA
jgi:hypothetical protein